MLRNRLADSAANVGSRPIDSAVLRTWLSRFVAETARLDRDGITLPGSGSFQRMLRRVITRGAQGYPPPAEDLDLLIVDARSLGLLRAEHFGDDVLAGSRVEWIEFLTRWRDQIQVEASPAPGGLPALRPDVAAREQPRALSAPTLSSQVDDVLWWHRLAVERARSHQLVAESQRRLLRARRLTARLTQAELAAKLDVLARTVQRWETGERHPTPRHRQELARLLGGRPADYDMEVE